MAFTANVSGSGGNEEASCGYSQNGKERELGKLDELFIPVLLQGLSLLTPHSSAPSILGDIHGAHSMPRERVCGRGQSFQG